MPIINLKKFYYPYYTEDTFIEVSDEVAEALLKLSRQENNQAHKIWYHKAYFSLDCADGIENYALNWEQPSPEDIFMQKEDEAYNDLMMKRLEEAISTLMPIQARRVRGRFMDKKKIREIAADEGISASNVSESICAALKNMKKYFDKKKWTLWED